LRTSPLNFIIVAIPRSDGPATKVIRFVAVSVAANGLRRQLFGGELIADHDRPWVLRVAMHDSHRNSASLEEADELIAAIFRRQRDRRTGPADSVRLDPSALQGPAERPVLSQLVDIVAKRRRASWCASPAPWPAAHAATLRSRSPRSRGRAGG
jgi:hypothetical protein